MKNRLSLLLIIGITSNSFAQSSDKLWYDEPALHFEESLVLGNGKHGATVFGGVDMETIYLNDITLWSGKPVNPNMNPDAHQFLPSIRAALANENYQLADSLNRKLQGTFSHSYAPLGTLKINFANQGEVQNYYRALDLNNALATVNYEQNGVKFKREYFVSYPDQVIVMKFTNDKKGALSFDIQFESLLKYQVESNVSELKATGYAPIYAAPSYFGDVANAVIFDEAKGSRFAARVKIKNTDGEVESSGSTLKLKNATEAIVYVSLATSFNGYDKNPVAEGADYLGISKKQLDLAIAKQYTQVKSDHFDDYKKFYDRVKLSLGSTTAPNLPTDERLKRYSEGKEDRNLEVLYFQYGRYLLISSSRTHEVPANLQGLWNPHIRPPWSSNYTMNINVEENYWLAENANLSEMHLPLLSFIQNLANTGEVTARTFYGAKGWAACHNSDIWAMTNPVGNFGDGYPGWANWNMGGAWISTHLWEHYVFTQDVEFLKNEAFPVMKGAAQFCLDWLVADKDGHLITSPCTSPENNYITDKGYHGATFYGGTADIAMIRELFTQTIAAAEELKIEAKFIDELKSAKEKLLPYHIGQAGNLQEWYHDWEDEDPKHRHQTHLFGLYPGHQITQTGTPELANACRNTLETKGDETTGWSKGWRINLWARLLDGNHSYKMYRELLRYVEPDGLRTNYASGGGTYPNLFDAHPPFQIDGNFGGAAAVIEMLLQSDSQQIHLLPALPDEWNTGEVKGICARGGFIIDMKWENGKLLTANVFSKSNRASEIVYQTKTISLNMKSGETKKLSF